MKTKLELINKLRSPDNKYALQAIEEMRVRGWLSDNSLKGIALCNAQLQGADLMNAQLIGVDFHQARLEWTDFSGANLFGVKFTRANLSGCNFNSANLANADLYKANLRGARNLTDEQLSTVKRLWGAIMPDGETYNGCFNLKADLDFALWSNININNPKAIADFYGVSSAIYQMGQGVKVPLSNI